MASEILLGSTKDTGIQEFVEMNFKGETNEVGLYLAMARQAEGSGYPEVAAALSKIAWEEAQHAARFAELNGKISPILKKIWNVCWQVNRERVQENMRSRRSQKNLELTVLMISFMSRPEMKTAMRKFCRVYYKDI